jgi:glycine betaine/proline transport system substrate-binding protein
MKRKGITMKDGKWLQLTGGLLAAGLVLAACGDDADGDDAAAPDNGEALEAWPAPGAPDYGADCSPTDGAAPVPDPDGTGGDDTNLTIGIFDGWDESYASAYLLAAIFEDMGYTVDTGTELEAGLAYAGVAGGDLDFVTDGWLPVTHDDLLDEFGENMESLGCWYDNAKLTIAVNDDAPVDSLAELADFADEFGGQVFGIEPGAGLTRITEEDVFPTYGLEEGGFSFDISSTPAMIAQLKAATDAGENVVVTLWEPHWAYDAFPIKNLDDPEGTLGETEFVFSFARDGFTAENSNAAQLVRNFVMTGPELAELENLMFSEEHYDGGDHAAAVADWLEANQDWVDRLKAGEL